jgi:dTDP-4-dehydrorhamnose 3,5-epimerase
VKLIQTNIPDVVIVEPKVFGDDRGWFMESFNEKSFHYALGVLGLKVPEAFVQDNQSMSKKGILRGLHYQVENTQGKLVRVVSGEVYDVAVDMRKNSPTLGQWVGVSLSAENKRQLWIPAGFAHGFYVTSKEAEFVYKCTKYYSPEYECSVLWNDEKLAIEWPIDGPLYLSRKDENAIEFNSATYLEI